MRFTRDLHSRRLVGMEKKLLIVFGAPLRFLTVPLS
jgi:hypothetical protein